MSSRFERQESARLGMPDAIAARHRTPHFQHIFSGGDRLPYYSYLWSEVLDADGFEAFEEAGDIFDPAVAKRLHDFVYAAGGSRDYDAAYEAFAAARRRPRRFRKRGFEAAAGEGQRLERAPLHFDQSRPRGRRSRRFSTALSRSRSSHCWRRRLGL